MVSSFYFEEMALGWEPVHEAHGVPSVRVRVLATQHEQGQTEQPGQSAPHVWWSGQESDRELGTPSVRFSSSASISVLASPYAIHEGDLGHTPWPKSGREPAVVQG